MSENCLATQTDKPIVALLIDGENISSAFAGKMIVAAGKLGELQVRRVYGNAAMIKGWDTAPGIQLVHSGAGKNAADIVLALDAFQLSYESKIDVFALVSSDGDFMHLATRLRERGFRVVGIGEKKAPECFRKSCSSWVTLAAAKAATKTPMATQTPALAKPSGSAVATKPPAPALSSAFKTVAIAPKLEETTTPSLDDQVFRIVSENPKGMTTSEVNELVRAGWSGQKKDQPQKIRISYFRERPESYLIEGVGSEALVKARDR